LKKCGVARRKRPCGLPIAARRHLLRIFNVRWPARQWMVDVREGGRKELALFLSLSLAPSLPPTLEGGRAGKREGGRERKSKNGSVREGRKGILELRRGTTVGGKDLQKDQRQEYLRRSSMPLAASELMAVRFVLYVYLYVCQYICLSVYLFVCMFVCLHVCLHCLLHVYNACMFVSVQVCMHVCFVRMFGNVYVCMCAYI